MTEVSQGNLDAMTLIFERYHKRLFNFFFQMLKDKDACDDMTQTVFYKALRYRGSYKGGQFVSWIFRIARNVFADHYQKHKNTHHLDLENVVVASDEKKDAEDNVAHLQSVLKILKPEEKELIVMNRLQGIKYTQLAEIFETNEGAIKVKVHRIIKKLRTVYFETI
jgi:RNA polymerase sigma-70 factor (ECF subfamily)